MLRYLLTYLLTISGLEAETRPRGLTSLETVVYIGTASSTSSWPRMSTVQASASVSVSRVALASMVQASVSLASLTSLQHLQLVQLVIIISYIKTSLSQWILSNSCDLFWWIWNGENRWNCIWFQFSDVVCSVQFKLAFFKMFLRNTVQ